MKITYQEVSNACEALVSSGERPTILLVRSKLGRGSESSIQPLVKKWRDSNQKFPDAAMISLPSSVHDEITAWVQNTAATLNANAVDRLLIAEQENVILAECNTSLEEKLSANIESLAEASNEKIRMSAIIENLHGKIVELEDLVVTARRTAAEGVFERNELVKNAESANLERVKLEHRRDDLYAQVRSLSEKCEGTERLIERNLVEITRLQTVLEQRDGELVKAQAQALEIAARIEVERSVRFEAEKLAAVAVTQAENAKLLHEICREGMGQVQSQLTYSRGCEELLRREISNAAEREGRLMQTIARNADRSLFEFAIINEGEEAPADGLKTS